MCHPEGQAGACARDSQQFGKPHFPFSARQHGRANSVRPALHGNVMGPKIGIHQAKNPRLRRQTERPAPPGRTAGQRHDLLIVNPLHLGTRKAAGLLHQPEAIVQGTAVGVLHPLGVVAIHSRHPAGISSGKPSRLAPDPGEQVATAPLPSLRLNERRMRSRLLRNTRRRRRRIEPFFLWSHQNGALRVQAHLQAGNLPQVEAEHPQPVRKAISGALAQGRDLADMGRDAGSDLVEESYGNEIGRLASVAPASGGGELGHGVSASGQYISDALGPGVPVTTVCSFFAGFDPAKRGSCARYSEETTNRCRRVHPSILARLLLSELLPRAASFGASLRPLQ